MLLFFLLKNHVELLALVLELFDVYLERFILEFSFSKDILQFVDDCGLLFNFKDVDVNFVLELHHFLLVLDDLLVSVDH
jgi:hypothetical protein